MSIFLDLYQNNFYPIKLISICQNIYSLMILNKMCSRLPTMIIQIFECIATMFHRLFGHINCPKGTFKYYVTFCDFKNLVAFGHKQSWRPPAANRGSCDFNDVVASGHNQLWRPPAAKFCL